MILYRQDCLSRLLWQVEMIECLLILYFNFIQSFVPLVHYKPARTGCSGLWQAFTSCFSQFGQKYSINIMEKGNNLQITNYGNGLQRNPDSLNAST